jgi:hypothetical protein
MQNNDGIIVGDLASGVKVNSDSDIYKDGVDNVKSDENLKAI